MEEVHSKVLEPTTMELIDVITSKENLNKAYKKVVANKGAGGVDGMKVEELGAYIRENKDELSSLVMVSDREEAVMMP
jgi:retron-type reverse transcriptase